MSIRKLTSGKLEVEVYADRNGLGRAAAEQVATKMRSALREHDHLSMMFAAAPSQNEFLASLSAIQDLDWQRVTAFQMDEYVGLQADAPQSFGKYLKVHLFDAVQPGFVHYLKSDAPEPETECQRYAELLAACPPMIVCAGIGENGHLAFNDPHTANFGDPQWVKIVELDLSSRQQQVNDGCFEHLEDVPTQALTVTLPVITNASDLSVVVPGVAKAEAVKATLHAPISTACPATILRRLPGAVLLVDNEAAAELDFSESQTGQREPVAD